MEVKPTAGPGANIVPEAAADATSLGDQLPPSGGASSLIKEIQSKEASKTNGSTSHTNAPDSSEANGTAPVEPSEVSPKQAEVLENGEDTAPKSSADTPAASNGTPVPSEKKAKSTDSARKRASIVPEHRSKKLTKKKSKIFTTQLDAQPGQYFFARMKGHSPWPSIICDEEMLPHSLLSSRPATAAQADGSFRKPEYAEDGKRAGERSFPVMFLHTNEFGWIPNTDLTPIDTASEAIHKPVEKGKSKPLLAAYAIAAEGNDLAYFKGMLAEHQQAIEEDLAMQEEEAAAKAERAEKKKATAAKKAADEANKMDVDDDAGSDAPKSKKRKKTAADSDGEEKPAKTPKSATKLKLSTPKQPASGTKPKSAKSNRKSKLNSDEEAQTKSEEAPPSPAALKEMKEKKVLYFRHKLQRGFLSRDTVPKADEMKVMSDFLRELETFPDLEGSIIRATKIHKVLKQMIKLDHIPLEEEYNFKDRSSKLLESWNQTLTSETPAVGTDEKVDAVNGSAPKTDGPVTSVETEKLEKADAPAETNGSEKSDEKVAATETAESEAKVVETKDGKADEEAKSNVPEPMDITDAPDATGLESKDTPVVNSA